MDKRLIVLEHDALIKVVGRKRFLVKISFDYSKKELFLLTEFGAKIVAYIRTIKKVSDVIKEFSNIADEEKIIKYLEFLSAQGYAQMWNSKQLNFQKSLSSIQKDIFMVEHTPYGATIELTSKCNFRCVHCYLDNCHNEVELPLEKIKYILDQLAKAGMLTIFLSGGEPLLRKDFPEIYLYAKKLGFLIVIFTNGYLLSDKLLDLFLQYPPLEIDISLYGASDEMYEKITGLKGAFSQIKQNILKYKEAGIFISSKTPVLNLMIDDLDNIKKFTDESNIPWRITFDIVPTIDNQEKNGYQIEAKTAVQLFKKYSSTFEADKEILLANLKNEHCGVGRRRYACGMGKSSCFVDYRGVVSPCIETRNRGVSIFDESFDNIWEKIRKITYENLPNEINDYKCMTCKLACICKSCPAVRERRYGQPYKVEKNDCDFTEELYKIIMMEKDL